VSRQLLVDRTLAARVRAIVKATPATSQVDVDVQATDGHVRLAGLVGSEAERESVLVVAREVPGVRQVSSDVKVFRRPVR